MAQQKTSVDYINSEELKSEYAKSLLAGAATKRLGELFMILTDHVLKHKNFARYPQAVKEDLKSYALLKLCRSVKTIKLEESDARRVFNYATRTCFTSFLTELGRYYKQQNIKREMTRKYCAQLETLDPQGAAAIEATLLDKF